MQETQSRPCWMPGLTRWRGMLQARHRGTSRKPNKALKGSDAYWRLNEARFEALGRGTRGARTTGQAPASEAGVPASGPG